MQQRRSAEKLDILFGELQTYQPPEVTPGKKTQKRVISSSNFYCDTIKSLFNFFSKSSREESTGKLPMLESVNFDRSQVQPKGIYFHGDVGINNSNSGKKIENYTGCGKTFVMVSGHFLVRSDFRRICFTNHFPLHEREEVNHY